jgi:gliding motility-associated-like protein
MARAFFGFSLLFLISLKAFGQCINPPTVSLTSTSGFTCGVTPATVDGNTFGGSATRVIITTDGGGKVNPASSTRSPFNFTYTPVNSDAGHIVVITVTTNIPKNSQCNAASATYSLLVDINPTVPVTGAITQPTCTLPTGSVDMSGLPNGAWTITASPGGNITSGTGSTATIMGIAPGTYTFTVTNSSGCTSPPTSDVKINSPPPSPAVPVVGTITEPTCTVATGDVNLTGLPSTGNWTLTRSPGNILISGSGTATSIQGLTQGSYTYTVTNSAGCTSQSTGIIIITAQPVLPSPPVVGTITAPTCSLMTGSVVLNGLPTGTNWSLTRTPGNVITSGSGASATLGSLPAGTYTFTVATSSGCISGSSANVVIPAQPNVPPAPLIGTITQPDINDPEGSVILNGLPASGSWSLTLSPGNIAIPGTGTTKTVSGLTAGTYSFTVTNSVGCTSTSSASFAINQLSGPPLVVITEPKPVCYPSTINITAPAVTAGSSPNLKFSYWTDAAGTISYATPSSATAGTYYIKGTSAEGYSTIKPVIVSVYHIPVPDGGPDQVLKQKFETTMNARLANDYESGVWSLLSGTGDLLDSTAENSAVSGLSFGKNLFLWTVSNKVCPTASDSVIITVSDLPPALPTLITPNMDGKNDYFVVKKPGDNTNMALIIFDRRGVEVYKNNKYDNSWNGVDYNGRQLPDDTYFYVLKTANGKSATGYIVVRRY